MARLLLEKTGVTISLQGERHLEAVIGSKEFKVQYVRNEVSGWNEICGVRAFRKSVKKSINFKSLAMLTSKG